MSVFPGAHRGTRSKRTLVSAWNRLSLDPVPSKRHRPGEVRQRGMGLFCCGQKTRLGQMHSDSWCGGPAWGSRAPAGPETLRATSKKRCPTCSRARPMGVVSLAPPLWSRGHSGDGGMEDTGLTRGLLLTGCRSPAAHGPRSLIHGLGTGTAWMPRCEVRRIKQDIACQVRRRLQGALRRCWRVERRHRAS